MRESSASPKFTHTPALFTRAHSPTIRPMTHFKNCKWDKKCEAILLLHYLSVIVIRMVCLITRSVSECIKRLNEMYCLYSHPPLNYITVDMQRMNWTSVRNDTFSLILFWTDQGKLHKILSCNSQAVVFVSLASGSTVSRTNAFCMWALTAGFTYFWSGE